MQQHLFLLKFFVYYMPVAEDKFVSNQILIEKDNWGAQGMRKYSKSYSLITEYLETKFFTAKHFIANSYNGEYYDNTKYQNMLECFGDYSKLEHRNIIAPNMTFWIYFLCHIITI